MDTMRGQFDKATPADVDFEPYEDEVAVDVRPLAMGRDERRMQVRAYNHWAGLLGDGDFPATNRLNLADLPDFAPSSVLIELPADDTPPTLSFIGQRLADEAGITPAPCAIHDVPAGSLLSRFAEHYMQIFANQAPIGFEAEFENPAGSTVLYRGILLPFSSDGAQITHILGTINWKEQLPAQASAGLLAELSRALDGALGGAMADGDGASLAHPATPPGARPRKWDWSGANWGHDSHDNAAPARWPLGEAPLPEDGVQLWPNAPAGAALGPELGAVLSTARTLAEAAKLAPPRDHGALYAAIGATHDFVLAARAAPAQAAALIAAAGLTARPGAPMLPYIKLVFGAEHDKTRLAEIAGALSYARRHGLGTGALSAHLSATPGGLKAIVAEERRHRRAATAPRKGASLSPVVAQALALMPAQAWDDVTSQEDDIAIAVVRRRNGRVEPLGRVSATSGLVERLLRQFLAKGG